uniref:RxLR effector protein n=1 Tax=Peronospora matthiolae TaxID=2874970 RepID=A0AAV1TEB3_9STRA
MRCIISVLAALAAVVILVASATEAPERSSTVAHNDGGNTQYLRSNNEPAKAYEVDDEERVINLGVAIAGPQIVPPFPAIKVANYLKRDALVAEKVEQAFSWFANLFKRRVRISPAGKAGEKKSKHALQH